MPELEIIPAVLVKTREDLLARIERVMPYVKNIQIDVMDGKFVPNKTVGLEELAELPMGVGYEFHWMVENPEQWIAQVPGPHLHLAHIETISSIEPAEQAVRKMGGTLGLAINPETPLERVLPYLSRIPRLLVMTVHPGFDGQKYMPEMEARMREVRALNKTIDIEVDGGLNLQTITGAVQAGANKLAASSAIFHTPDPKEAMEKLRQMAAEAQTKQRKENEAKAWATE